jgi:RNA polymerase sigma factor (sigma-70 family)
MANTKFCEAYVGLRQLAQWKAQSLARSLGLRTQDREDIESELLCRIWQRYSSYNHTLSSIQTFASRSMDRDAISTYRYRRAACRDAPHVSIEDVRHDPATASDIHPALRCHFWVDVHRALAACPEIERRTALALIDASPTEISAEFGCSRPTVYARVSRVRAALAAGGVTADYFHRTRGAA